MRSPRSIVESADRVLTRLEGDQLEVFIRHLRRTQGLLEEELRVRYLKLNREAKDLSTDFRYARALAVLEEIQAVLDRFNLQDAPGAKKALEKLVKDSRKIGAAQANAFTRGLPKVRSILDLNNSLSLLPAAEAVVSSRNRLANHSADHISKINQIVIDGILTGRGWGKTSSLLRMQTGMLGYEAERIVRTESLSNSDLARRKAYADDGIDFVQRIATQDDRICKFCAARAGKVYRVDEAPAALHPNDRCYNLPWHPDWEEEGLIDNDFYLQHRTDIKQKLEDEGRSPSYGRSPFERSNDIDPPKAIWSPESGYTEFGRRIL